MELFERLLRIEAQLQVQRDVAARLIAEASRAGTVDIPACHQALVQDLTASIQTAPASDEFQRRFEALLHEEADSLFARAQAHVRAFPMPPDRGS